MRIILPALFTLLVLSASLSIEASPLPTLEVVEARAGKQGCAGKVCKIATAVLCCGAHSHTPGGNPNTAMRERRKKYGDPRFLKTPSPEYHDAKNTLSPFREIEYGKGPRPASKTTQTFKKENYSGFKNALEKEKKMASKPGSPAKPASPPKPASSHTGRLQSVAEGKRPKKASPSHSPSTSYAMTPDRREVVSSSHAFKRHILSAILLGKRVFTKGCMSAVCKDVATTGGSTRNRQYHTPNYTGKYLAEKDKKPKEGTSEGTPPGTPFHSASSSPLPSPNHNPTMATHDKPPNHALDMSRYRNWDPEKARHTLQRIDKAREERHAQQFRTVRPEPKKSLGTKMKTVVKEAFKPAPHHHHRRSEESLQGRGQCGSTFCADVTGNKLVKGTSHTFLQSAHLAGYATPQKKQGGDHHASTSHSNRFAGSDPADFSHLDVHSPHGSPAQSPPRLSVQQTKESSQVHRKIITSAPKSQRMKGTTSGIKKSHGRREVKPESMYIDRRGNAPSSSAQRPSSALLKPVHREGPAGYHKKGPQELQHDHHHQCFKNALAYSPLLDQQRPQGSPLRWPSLQRISRERAIDDLVARAHC